jgi:hypothetical protein
MENSDIGRYTIAGVKTYKFTEIVGLGKIAFSRDFIIDGFVLFM